MKHFRQGDVLILEVSSIPTKAEDKTPKGASVILAYGEVTGHCHQIQESHGVRIFEHEGSRWIRVPKGGKGPLMHEEHGTIPFGGVGKGKKGELVEVPTGDYEVVIQKEYIARELRNVAD